MAERELLRSSQMASFVARGYLRFDAVVPQDINDQFLDEDGRPPDATGEKLMRAYRRLMAENRIPAVPAGVPLVDAYAGGSALARLLDLPIVRGAIESLVGPDSRFDHHFLHITFPPAFYEAMGVPNQSQHNHQDSTIDVRRAF